MEQNHQIVIMGSIITMYFHLPPKMIRSFSYNKPVKPIPGIIETVMTFPIRWEHFPK